METHPPARDLAVSLFRDLQKVCENPQRDIAYPLSLDEMRLTMEVMVYSNLDKIARKLRST